MGPSSLLHVITRLKEALSVQDTKPASQIHLLYREPGVEAGYRPTGKPLSYYVISIFQLNNETVNIWTHFIAAAIFLLSFFVLTETANGQEAATTWPFTVFGICTTAYAALSAFAHAFHSKSPDLHYLCFQLDYSGIGLYALGTNVLIFHTGCPDWLYQKLCPFSFFINVTTAWIFVIGCSIAKLKYRRPYPPQRKLIQLVAGTVSVSQCILVLAYRLMNCLSDDGDSVASLYFHGRWILPFGLSVFFFSSHLPEKLYPGLFDYVGQGHQLFHVLIALTSLWQYEASREDTLTAGTSFLKIQDYTISGVLMMFLIYICGCILIIAALKKTVNNRVKEDLKSD